MKEYKFYRVITYIERPFANSHLGILKGPIPERPISANPGFNFSIHNDFVFKRLVGLLFCVFQVDLAAEVHQ